MKTAVSDSNKSCKVIFSQPVTQLDDGKAWLTISKLKSSGKAGYRYCK